MDDPHHKMDKSLQVYIPHVYLVDKVQSVQLKSGPYFNMSSLFTKI